MTLQARTASSRILPPGFPGGDFGLSGADLWGSKKGFP